MAGVDHSPGREHEVHQHSYESASEQDAKNDPIEDQVLELPDRNLFGVLDGMGGAGNGDKASFIAKEAIINAVKDSPRETDDLVTLSIAMHAANQTVVDFNQANGLDLSHETNSGTTASIMMLKPKADGFSEVTIAQVGDSRVYIAREDGRLEMVTMDQVGYPDPDPLENWNRQLRLSEVKVDTEILKKDRITFAMRHIIGMSIGGREKFEPSFFKAELGPNDRIFSTTDGVHDNLTTSEMQAIAKAYPSKEGLSNALVAEAKNRAAERTFRSKRDDISVVVIEGSKPEKQKLIDHIPEFLTTEPYEEKLKPDEERDIFFKDGVPIRFNIGGEEMELHNGDDETFTLLQPGRQPIDYTRGQGYKVLPAGTSIELGRVSADDSEKLFKFSNDVSRHHAQLQVGFNEVGAPFARIKDLNSTNGTFVPEV